LPALSRAAYSNCKLIAPNGVLMCRVAAKRAKWYVERGLAEVVAEEPFLEVRLLFTPGGYGNHDDPFYLTEKPNSCVVCGGQENLTKHHCVPSCFRRHFPARYKSHTSRDVLVVCDQCHIRYEFEADKLKQSLLGRVTKAKALDKAPPYARTLAYNGHLIPAGRRAEMEAVVALVTGGDLSLAALEKVYADEGNGTRAFFRDYVDSIADLGAFVRRWRAHFMTTMEPAFMPLHWNVDDPVYRDEDVSQK
jgi:hypothetical protein